MPMNHRTLRPGSTFTPRSISGLALWLDAADSGTLFQDAAATVPATATNDPVGAWLDKSGNGRHATQSTASYRGAVGTQGSRRAITLDGTDDHLLLGNLSAAFPTAGEVVTAYALNAVDTAYTVYQTSDNSNSDVFGGITFAGTFRNTRLAGLTLSGPSAVGTHLWGVSSQSSGYNIWVEGSNALSTTADHTGGNNHAIGMRSATPGSNQAMNGKLLEVCAFNRVLSATERVRLNRYLAAKWGITLAPQVSNADAQDWINRVYANGGTVSASTASAVNQFCVDIENAGIRDRFYRLNLFAGNSDASLAAVRTPLFRGPSLTGTQYGNTLDTNVNFVAADYAETGVGGGLLGNGSSKHLRTGLATNALTVGDRHLSAYEVVRSGATYDLFLGSDVAGSQQFILGYGLPANVVRFGFGAFASNATSSATTTGGHWLGVSPTTGTGIIYKNGAADGNNVQTATTPPAYELYALANNRDNAATDFYGGRLGGYSIGAAFTAAKALDYYKAMQAFQTALGRQV